LLRVNWPFLGIIYTSNDKWQFKRKEWRPSSELIRYISPPMTITAANHHAEASGWPIVPLKECCPLVFVWPSPTISYQLME